ncbi:N-acetylmuramoyl-L-alanine amidase-like domain-containing protein [Maribellus sediminis]|uniref:N-acetylmuramoyl-L-alanine amidase-like domain-containing protein n=1 Tax=Maribellus sediminis TaxID=2696285 RepID=UPI0014311FD3|nr:N-acetylmuramoyl-L-alanine amidase-like domain-containing protein [Maribellus sediminis]
MRFQIILLLSILLTASCTAQSAIIYEEEDKAILTEIFNKLEKQSDKTTAELVVLAGESLLGTPYVAHTLESEPEQLVVNLRELDCTTYTENCLAIARCVKSGKTSFKNFTAELRKIRYRNGVINGYPSRLHYFSDWIFENEKQGIIKQVSEAAGHTKYPLELDFMSTHPGSYKQLEGNKEFVQMLSAEEKEINKREMFFIPEDEVAKYEVQLKPGDIVGICTSIKGLDISHVGILVSKNNRIYLMHASSSGEKVMISDSTLEDYLKVGKSTIGIMVARPI